MSPATDPETLAPDDLTTYRIGQIMRETVRMESTLRELHARLQDVPYDRLKEPKGRFSDLIEDVRIGLGRLDDFPLAEEAGAMLAAAADVYRERNRFAHDVHLHASDARVIRVRLAYSARGRRRSEISTGTLGDVLRQIRAVTTHIIVTSQLAAVWLPREQEPFEPKESPYVSRLVGVVRTTPLTSVVAETLPPGSSGQ